MSKSLVSNKTGKRARKPASPDAVIKRRLAAKRKRMMKELQGKYFLLGGMPLATDTYKRTMATADQEVFAMGPAAYSLTPRKGLPGCDHLIMAGSEFVQPQWFHKPLKRSDIELALWHCKHESAVLAYPEKAVEMLLAQPGKDIYLPIDIWGFPGGQAFPVLEGKPKVPVASYEGMGFALSNIEPAQCRYSAPIQHATMARIFEEAFPQEAEFGLRAAPDEASSMELLFARYVGTGGRAKLTSNDQADFLMPRRFRAIGTVGHEFMGYQQRPDRSLGEAERMAMEKYVSEMKSGMLLTDLVDAETIGFLNALAVLAKYPQYGRIGVRLDSGDIAGGCVLYYNGMKYAIKIVGRTIVFENEVTPTMAKEVGAYFLEKTGTAPTMLFPGAGGFWWKVHRDNVSMAFKRTATGDYGNVKFSNSPGKESLPGYLRVYRRGTTMIIGDAREGLKDELLFVKLVDQGRYIYDESLEVQAERADRTWRQYTNVELSPMVADTLNHYVQMRERERAQAAPLVAEVFAQIDAGRKADGLPALYTKA